MNKICQIKFVDDRWSDFRVASSENSGRMFGEFQWVKLSSYIFWYEWKRLFVVDALHEKNPIDNICDIFLI
jgi:hypothetical protein